ncbi:coat-like protein [Prochlorococcus marinus]|uniref:coat-like protein n=1 Tax=Prochlorococcus marinus TaxID=1219 RepID=UPI001ADD2C56|nr:coat-like protein [Prochlorococcus marinus CUG1416]MBW3051367.1 coat-like protein [Prochlorococcus marinus str. MU1416]
MFFENPPKNIESLIAKSADITNKPFVHSVVKINGEYAIEEEDIDLTVNILCRDKEGKRLEIYDLELELFKSNKELVLVISKLNFPDEPILWCGVKTLWMDSNNGKKCNAPKYSSRLENLANRIKSFID